MTQIRLITEDNERVDIGVHDVPTFEHDWERQFPNHFGSHAPYALGARVRVVRKPRLEAHELRGVVGRVRWRGSYVNDDNRNGWMYLIQPVDQERLPAPITGITVTREAGLGYNLSIPLYAIHDTDLSAAPRGSELPEMRDADEDELFFEDVDHRKQWALNWHGRRVRAWGTTYTGYVALKQTWQDNGDKLAGEWVVVVHEPYSKRFLLPNYEYPQPSEADRFRHTWGYNGTGPRQLAFAILCDVLGEKPTKAAFEAGASLALAMTHDFKQEVIEHLPQPDSRTRNLDIWCLSADLVTGWINGWTFTHTMQLHRWAERMVSFERVQEANAAAEKDESLAEIDAEEGASHA